MHTVAFELVGSTKLDVVSLRFLNHVGAVRSNIRVSFVVCVCVLCAVRKKGIQPKVKHDSVFCCCFLLIIFFVFSCGFGAHN